MKTIALLCLFCLVVMGQEISPSGSGGGGTPGGTAGGDLSGTYPNPTVAKVNGSTPGGTCTNQFVSAMSSSAIPTCTTISLISAAFANQGTTVTVLHGNAAGNPSFGPVVGSDMTANTVTSTQTAVVNNRRTCVFDNDTQSATALVVANFSGGCVISAAATIVEVDVIGGTGVLTGSAAAPTVTGTSSIQIGKYTPNGGSSTTGLLSAALATASGKACALTSTSGTCINGTTSSNSVTISTTALAAGDMLYQSAATPDTAQTWYRTTVVYTVN